MVKSQWLDYPHSTRSLTNCQAYFRIEIWGATLKNKQDEQSYTTATDIKATKLGTPCCIWPKVVKPWQSWCMQCLKALRCAWHDKANNKLLYMTKQREAPNCFVFIWIPNVVASIWRCSTRNAIAKFTSLSIAETPTMLQPTTFWNGHKSIITSGQLIKSTGAIKRAMAKVQGANPYETPNLKILLMNTFRKLRTWPSSMT